MSRFCTGYGKGCRCFRATRLIRCYANGTTYGSDGTIHIDSKSDRGFTSVYYSHPAWYPRWAGETVIFNDDKSDIVASVYPKPNRLVVFAGNAPHVARGVSRTCPVLRVTLMFKTLAQSHRGGLDRRGA